MLNFLYIIKQAIRDMIAYREFSLTVVDYDKYWSDKRGKNMGALSDWQKSRARYIVETLKNKGQFSFVDIGCGDGAVLNYLKQQGVVSRAVGIDISPLALESAKRFGIETIQADITDKQFLKEIPATDYVILFETLEHIGHAEEMLKVACENSEKGVFLSFPNTGFLTYRLRLLLGKFPLQWRLYPGEHLRFWTAADLRWWLNSLGYKNYKIFYYKGVPVLNKIMPALFAAGFVVHLGK